MLPLVNYAVAGSVDCICITLVKYTCNNTTVEGGLVAHCVKDQQQQWGSVVCTLYSSFSAAHLLLSFGSKSTSANVSREKGSAVSQPTIQSNCVYRTKRLVIAFSKRQ